MSFFKTILSFFSCGVPKQAEASQNKLSENPIKAILFDTFGTVVDWRGSLVKELKMLLHQKSIDHIDTEAFIADWVKAYSENMTAISEGRKPFALVDELNAISLQTTLASYDILDKVSDQECEQLWMAWHRLEPWQDAVDSINQLSKQYLTGPLSNGNLNLLRDLTRHADLQWQVILSGETFKCYKPNPIVYLQAAKHLNLQPSEILLVASHKYDLQAAQKCGYKTAYIYRPLEFKEIHQEQTPKEGEFDYIVDSLDSLENQLNEVNIPVIHGNATF